jgi:hypothetical protein
MRKREKWRSPPSCKHMGQAPMQERPRPSHSPPPGEPARVRPQPGCTRTPGGVARAQLLVVVVWRMLRRFWPVS